jgi:MurNAc alpha-1-phosphate uridylyltransferase
LQRVSKSYGYDGQGDFNMDSSGSLTWRKEGESADFVFTGLQIINPVVFKKPQVLEMGRIFPVSKIYKAFMPQTKGVENDGKWYHIGTPKALKNITTVF